MKILLINPRISILKNDYLGSGVPYWPIEAATFVSFLKNRNEHCEVIDLFGSAVRGIEVMESHFLQGQNIDSPQWIKKLELADCFIIFAISFMSHKEVLNISRFLRNKYPNKRILILENSQAVTAYAIDLLANEFFPAGVDALICGEPYLEWNKIKKFIEMGAIETENIECLLHPNKSSRVIRTIKPLQKYPIPALEDFPFENYWSLPYSHGPKRGKFLPILTSRGCPYPCDFCVIPELNSRRWRANEPKHVVEEIMYLKSTFSVNHFQIEDVNPTVSHDRWEEICTLLIEENANIEYSFVSGTKSETISIESIPLFAESGCKYISISPESGSEFVMKRIGKKFDKEHGIALVREARLNGIRTQACFLVGHPSESRKDFKETKKYLKKLIYAGLDETAIFIVSAFAGSKIYKNNEIKSNGLNMISTFSPKNRKNYFTLSMRRNELIFYFFLHKIFKDNEIWKSAYRSLFARPETKMENLPKRIFFIQRIIKDNSNRAK